MCDHSFFSENRFKISEYRWAWKDKKKSGQPFKKPYYYKNKKGEFVCQQLAHLIPFSKEEENCVCQETFATFYDLYCHFAEVHAINGEHIVNLCVACEKIYDETDFKVCRRVLRQRKKMTDLNGDF